MIWANLIHLSFNMWADRPAPEFKRTHVTYTPDLRCDTKVWNEILQAMVKAGMNMVVIDLGDGVKYESHPEFAVRKAWTPTRLRRELKRIRKMGLEPIPKMNFSTAHDAWLGPYARCVSTDTYYTVCRDLIAEAIALFDKPRFFHLGMDEETAHHQRFYEYAVLRQHDLWWRDLYFYIEEVEKQGVRPWIWADYVWNHPKEFFKRMPKSVVQSNWYYGPTFRKNIYYVKAYLDLQAHGYDQIPTGSTDWDVNNFPKTVAYCDRHIEPRHLMGYFQTVWRPTLPAYRKHHMRALREVKKGKAEHDSKR